MLSKVSASARLTDRVAALLADEIASGRLGAGDRLPTEPQLVEKLGVSRTVIREAIALLRNSGLVESRQGVGVFVLPARVRPLDLAVESEPSVAFVLHILEVRQSIEVAAARLAAQRADAPRRREIRRALDAISTAVQDGRDGVKEDLAFHIEIARASGNPVLTTTLSYLAEVMGGGIRVSRTHESERVEFMLAVEKEHQALFAAIDAGDGDAAAQAAAEHLQNAAQRLRTTNH